MCRANLVLFNTGCYPFIYCNIYNFLCLYVCVFVCVPCKPLLSSGILVLNEVTLLNFQAYVVKQTGQYNSHTRRVFSDFRDKSARVCVCVYDYYLRLLYHCLSKIQAQKISCNSSASARDVSLHSSNQHRPGIHSFQLDSTHHLRWRHFGNYPWCLLAALKRTSLPDKPYLSYYFFTSAELLEVKQWLSSLFNGMYRVSCCHIYNEWYLFRNVC